MKSRILNVLFRVLGSWTMRSRKILVGHGYLDFIQLFQYPCPTFNLPNCLSIDGVNWRGKKLDMDMCDIIWMSICPTLVLLCKANLSSEFSVNLRRFVTAEHIVGVSAKE